MNLTLIFQEVFITSLMGTVLTMIILAVKLIFKDYLSKKWHYAIWFILLIRLIMPFGPEFEYSIYNLFKPIGEEVQLTKQILNTPELSENYTDTLTDSPEGGFQASYNGEKSISENIKTYIRPAIIRDVLATIWVAGLIIMVVATALFNALFYRKARLSIPCCDKHTIKILDNCSKIASVKPIPLLLNSEVKGPLLFGLIRPRLLVSEEVLEHLTENEKKHIFLHELVHYKQKDILINWIIAALRCIYWFNPVILFAFRKIRIDCEISCDERVLEKLEPKEYTQYGRTILNLVEFITSPDFLACTSSIIQKKSIVKRRIYMIIRFRQKTAFATVMALILTLLVGCAALTNAKDSNINDSSSVKTPETMTNPTQSENIIESDNNGDEQISAENSDNSAESGKLVNTEDDTVKYYLEKLKDKSFTGTYGDGQEPKVWYTAAEELGMLGKPAIPGLIEKLRTDDDYERALALYALLLSSQHENVKEFTNGEYIDVTLDFNPDTHKDMVDKAMTWWNKYKDNF